MTSVTQEWKPVVNLNPPLLKANLDALRMRQPYVYQTIAPHLNRTDILVRLSPNGELQCKQTRGDGTDFWIAGEKSLEVETQVLLEKTESILKSDADLLFCFGLGLGQIAIHAIERLWMSKRFLVFVERDPAVFVALLCLHNLTPVAVAPNFIWLLGKDAISNPAHAMAQYGLFRQSKAAAFRGAMPRVPEEQQADERVFEQCKDILSSMTNAHAQRVETLSERYAQREDGQLRKVMILDLWADAPGGVHLKCLKKALEDEGVEVHHYAVPRTGWVLKVPGHKRRASGWFLDLVETTQPDLVLTIQTFRSWLLPDDLLDKVPIPWINYVTAVSGLDFQIGQNEHVAIGEAGVARFLQEEGYPRISVLPLAANVLERPVDLPPWPFENYELTFQGRIFIQSKDDEEKYRKKCEKFPGLYDCLQDLLKELVKPDIPVSLYDVSREYLSQWEMDYPERLEAMSYLLKVASSQKRVDVVRALLDQGIRVFGTAWENVLSPEEMERCFVSGLPITQDWNMYTHSAININVHSVGHEFGTNMRFFNVPAAGAFQICDDRRDYGRYLESGKEIVYYRTCDELCAAVEKYRKDPEARQAIAQGGRQRILAEHTYHHRLKELIKIMCEAVGAKSE